MFGLLSKKPRSEVGKVGGFGKVPALGDFVRTPSASDEMVAFEAWLTRAMETGEARSGAAFKEGFTKVAPHAFVWSGSLEKKTRGVIAGVIVPSKDSVGRHFPIVVAVPLPPAALAPHPHLIPLLLHEFFQHALTAATRAATTRSAAEFHAQLAAISPPSLDDTHGSLALYSAWTKGQAANEIWTSIYGDNAERGREHALHMIVEATAAYRGQDTPALTLGLRAPMGSNGRRVTALWIDLVRQAAGWEATIPSLFFPLAPGARDLLIQLGAEPPPTVLADLAVPSPDSENVCDLTPAAGTSTTALLPPNAEKAASAQTLADVAAALGA